MPKAFKSDSATYTARKDSNLVFVTPTRKVKDNDGKVVQEIPLSVRDIAERVMQRLRDHETVIISARGMANIRRIFDVFRSLNGIAKSWDLKYGASIEPQSLSYKNVPMVVKDKRDSSGKTEITINVPEVTMVAQREVK